MSGYFGLKLTHEKLERNPPLVYVRGQRRAEGGHEAHVLAREDEGHVGAEAEERVVLLRLLGGRDLNSALLPWDDGDDDDAPGPRERARHRGGKGGERTFLCEGERNPE